MSKVKSKRLGDIVNFKRGYDLPAHQRKQGDYPVVSSSGISGYHSEYKADGEGIITGRYGTLGEMHYVNGKYWPHNTALYVTDFKGNHPKYVYYLLKCLGNLKTSDKSTVPGINRNDLHELIVPYIAEGQEAIAVVLSAIDQKIEINNRINAELEAMAKTLYDYWFVQFDFPDENGKPYKSSGGKMAYSKELKREIPAGWEATILGDFCSPIRGVTYSKADVEVTGAKNSAGILRATNISGNKIDINNLVYVNDSLIDKKQYMNQGDILIVMSSGSKEHIGKNGVYYFKEKVAFGAFCSKLSLKGDFSSYVNNFLGSGGFKAHIANSCLGTNINNLTNQHIVDCMLIKPEQIVLTAFEKKTSGFYKEIAISTQENQQLAALRDWLLPMLMNGQVQVTAIQNA